MTSSFVPSGAPKRAGGDSPQGGITVDFAINVLRRWWKVVIPTGLVAGTIAAAVVFFTFKPMYRAQTLVWIAERTPYLVDPSQFRVGPNASDQLGLIRSALVLGPAISRPEIASLSEVTQAEDPIGALRRVVDVTKAWGTEHYYVTCVSPNPANAAAIANAVTDSYFSLVGEYDAGRDKRLIELLEREKEASLREVERLRENVRQMTIEQKGKDPWASPELDAATRFPLASFQNQLTTIRVEQSVLRSQLAALEEYAEANPSGVSEAMIDRAIDENPEVRQQKGLIEMKRALLEDVKAKAVDGEKSSRYLALQSEMLADQESLDNFCKGLRESTKERLTGEMSKQQQSKLRELKARLAEYEAREAVLAKAFEAEVAKIKQFSGDGLALEIKRAELARADSVMDRISQRAFMLRTEQRAPERVELLEKATIPVRPIEDAPYKKMLMVFAAAFAGPYGLAFLWDLRIRRVTSAEQLTDHAALPVVGEIACLPSSVGQKRYFGAERSGRQVRLFEESVEALRICLVMTKSLSDTRVLAVCSAASQEGKTTLAAQLAISMARSAEGQVLLVDGDLRAPDMHTIFEVENHAGLAEVLSHKCTLDEAVVSSWDARLHVLPAGHLKGRPHELVRGDAFKDVIDEARDKYRYIIIDTPPVLPAGESLVMAAAADATLVCTRRDVSRQEQVRKTCDRLVAAGANVIGCVFSGIPLSKYKYRYGGYYYGEKRKRRE